MGFDEILPIRKNQRGRNEKGGPSKGQWTGRPAPDGVKDTAGKREKVGGGNDYWGGEEGMGTLHDNIQYFLNGKQTEERMGLLARR